LTIEAEDRSGFDWMARAYRWLEYGSFGPLLMRCRVSHLARMAGRRRALVLGDGDGRFSARLLETDGRIHIVALDESAAMLASLERRARGGGAGQRVTTRRGEIVGLLEAGNFAEEVGGFDLVVSHFFLDCLTTPEVGRVAVEVRRRMGPDGEWVISEFEGGSLAARMVVALLYKGFGLLAGLKTQRLPEYREALEASGWKCVAESRFGGGLLSGTVWRIWSGSVRQICFAATGESNR
jgi:SAM-dependent methyltransferase